MRLVDQIRQVAARTNAADEVIHALERAVEKTNFREAVDAAQDFIPKGLYINNQNPLTLLYTALSKAVHEELSEDQALELGQDIRALLVELGEKIGDALKDDREIKNAVSRLSNPNSGKSTAKDGPSD